MKKMLILLLLVSVFSCKKEIKEKVKNVPKATMIENKELELRNSINEILIKQPDRLTFKKEILPLVNKMIEIDSNKHRLLGIIANKLSREDNSEAFSLSVLNFKKELAKK